MEISEYIKLVTEPGDTPDQRRLRTLPARYADMPEVIIRGRLADSGETTYRGSGLVEVIAKVVLPNGASLDIDIAHIELDSPNSER